MSEQKEETKNEKKKKMQPKNKKKILKEQMATRELSKCEMSKEEGMCGECETAIGANN